MATQPYKGQGPTELLLLTPFLLLPFTSGMCGRFVSCGLCWHSEETHGQCLAWILLMQPQHMLTWAMCLYQWPVLLGWEDDGHNYFPSTSVCSLLLEVWWLTCTCLSRCIHGRNTCECEASGLVYASSCAVYSYIVTLSGSLSFPGPGCLSLIMSRLWLISKAAFSGAHNRLWLCRCSRLHIENISHCWHVLPRTESSVHTGRAKAFRTCS